MQPLREVERDHILRALAMCGGHKTRAARKLGISASTTDDQEALRLGMTLYDALYAWARFAAAETHNWPAARTGTAKPVEAA